MEKEKFVEALKDSRWNCCLSHGPYYLYERDGNYIFLFSTYISDSLEKSKWKIDYSDIKVVRNRRDSFEIEKIDGSSIFLLSEDEYEIGCMG